MADLLQQARRCLRDKPGLANSFALVTRVQLRCLLSKINASKTGVILASLRDPRQPRLRRLFILQQRLLTHDLTTTPFIWRDHAGLPCPAWAFTVLNTNELANSLAALQFVARFPLFAGATTMSHPLLPHFTWETATEKVRAIEDSWNSREPTRVALCYTIDSFWRSRIEFLSGRAAIEAFLTRKWAKELEYRRINELWTFTDNRISARFAYECHDEDGNWYRAYGSENWELDPDGLIRRRIASINDHPIVEADRMFFWPLGRRPDDHPELSDFDF